MHFLINQISKNRFYRDTYTILTLSINFFLFFISSISYGQSLEKINTFELTFDLPTEVRFSGDNTFLTLGEDRFLLRQRELSIGLVVNNFFATSFDQKNQGFIATTFNDNAIIWDQDSGSIREFFTFNSIRTNKIAISSNQNSIAIANIIGNNPNRSEVGVWNLPLSSKPVNVLPLDSFAAKLIFLENGNLFISTGQRNIVWNYQQDEIVIEFGAPGRSEGIISYNPERNLIIQDARGQVNPASIDINSGEIQTIFEISNPIGSLQLTPNGNYIALGHLNGQISFFDLETGEPMNVIQAHQNEVISMDFSPNGNRLLTLDTGGIIKLWNFSIEQSTLIDNWENYTSLR